MTKPDEPSPCADETGERGAMDAERDSLAGIMRVGRAYYPVWPLPAAAAPQPHRLPTAAELTDNATYAAMLEVMRQAEAMRREAWASPCCAVCGQPVATLIVADGVAFRA